ncbi:MAG TPA: LPXTG cell wall anchor domain-containing protein, partial [Clostridiaceae bacterium]|nr:LPXTG cell wall anchor domain-containing protein [Clostridiaceae bacterium]
KGNDWIELYNNSTADVDISGWIISDDKGLERLTKGKTTPFPEGTIITAGGFLVLEVDAKPYDFGLGDIDAVNLYDKDQNLIDSMSYTGHAADTLGRVPDGTGAFVETVSTKGSANQKIQQNPKIVINEVESEDANGGKDWVELYNYSTEDVNISGWIISDDKGLARLDDGSTNPFPEATIIKAGEFLVFDVDVAPYNFGLGKNDAVNLYDQDKNLIDSMSYTGHALDTWGRVPDGTGAFVETLASKGQVNVENTNIVEDEYIESTLKINEIETNHDVFEDYVEIINIGEQPVDISGWYIMDDDPVGHASQFIPVAAGTIIEPGQLFVFDTNSHFTFGLGKNDTVTLRNPEGKIADQYTWSGGHPAGTWSRVPDGTGDFRDYPNSKGVLNQVINQAVVINEIESNGSDRDWVEIFNNSENDIDISGWYIKDDSADHFSVRLPQGTILPAQGYFVFEADLENDIKHFNFGLGSSDKAELYDANDNLIDEHAWTAHAKFGLSRIPNGVGDFKDVPLTKGSENKDADVQEEELKPLDTIAWPGPQGIQFIDKVQMFKEDSSGLAYRDGALWLVDNGTGTIWKLLVDDKGVPSFAPGFENGKIVKFQKDAGTNAPGPDAEGICLDDNGMVFIAAERDNSAKGVNLNIVLQVNPNEQSQELVALKEWNITDHIDQARKGRGLEYYQVKANMGIEAIEWIPNSALEGKLFDMNTNAPYQSANYSTINDGLFFLGLEDDGYIYVFALKADETAELVTQIDTEMNMVMGLNYDELTDEIWAQTDNGRLNVLARIILNGSKNADITYYNPPQELDPLKNNEGFAIASINVNGLRPVYWVEDGITVNSLKMGYIETYKFPAKEPEVPKEPAKPENPETEETKEIQMLTATDVWSKESGQAARFISSADFADFISVKLNGEVVDPKNYDLSEGSIIVDFKPSFLATLPAGKHTVEIVAKTGTARANLEIKEKAMVTTTTQNAEQIKTEPNLAKTGEISVSIFVVLSFILLGVILIITRRKVKQEK